MSSNEVVNSAFIAKRLGVGKERARQLMKVVKTKTGYDRFTLREFIENSNEEYSPQLFV